MKRVHVLSGLVLVFVLVSAGVFFFFPSKTPLREFPITVTVAEHPGLDISPRLHFQIPPGAAADRKVFLENNQNVSVRITPHMSGDIASWVKFFPTEMTLLSFQNGTFMVRVDVPDMALMGNYTGTISLSQYPKN